MRTETVTSARNPKVSLLLSLAEKSKLRREKGLFIVEGRRELGHCLDSGFIPETIFACPDIISSEDLDVIISKAANLNPDCSLVLLGADAYAKAAYRDGTEGIIAEIRSRETPLGSIPAAGSPLVIVMEGVEKPGNLGAVLRSADACGATAAIVCDPLTDIYNPNLIRASIGSVFTVPVVQASSADAIKWLKENGFRIFTAQLQDSVPYYSSDLSGPTAIVMGTESTGLSQAWRDAADEHIRIPMLGKLDSLNVSVSAAILLFEVARQRRTI